MGKGGSPSSSDLRIKNLSDERLMLLYKMYEQKEIDHALRTLSIQAVTDIANEIVMLKPKYKEGGPDDTDEVAEQLMYAVVDEFAERTKAEVRYRVQLGKADKALGAKENND